MLMATEGAYGAQEVRATVTGRVTDPQGAVLPGTSVTATQQRQLGFRVEMFNALNTPIYGAPDTGVNSPRFGRIMPDQINFPRQTQLGLRLVF
jgi:hypothetical protein